jgi:hypothetical protein
LGEAGKNGRGAAAAGAELVDDLLDGGWSFAGHGRAGTQHRAARVDAIETV